MRGVAPLLAFLLFFAHGAPAPAQPSYDVAALRQRIEVRWRHVPRRVLAFYYPWYGTPEFSGRWVHWSGVDLVNKRLASSTHFPLLGPYDSLDPKVINQHMRWAKEAGIDGFISSWWGPKDRTDRALPLLLNAAARYGLKITAYIEHVPQQDVEGAVERVRYLLNNYAGHPAWLKVERRPVFFVYVRAVNQIGLAGWLQVITAVNRRYPGGAVFIADQISRPAAQIFDGIHTYNITAQTAGKSVAEIQRWARDTYAAQVRTAGQERIACVTVIPGYDDTKLGRPQPRPVTDRHDGATYRTLWREAIAANPDWILITSWNEWHEGSEIEPSLEFGDRELRTTAKFAPQFRRLAPRHHDTSGAPQPLVLPEELKAKLADAGVGVLPGAESDAFWFLVESGVPLTPLSWETIATSGVDPESIRYLVYAAGEVYRATVRKRNDVLGALQKYVDQGGTLLVLPAGPMPFHYDGRPDRQRIVNHGRALGLPLQVAWERPDRELRFLVHARSIVANLPGELPFPRAGDRRWRPLVPSPDVEVLPLIELVDASGTPQGLGAAIVRRGRGRIVYVWFRLLEGATGRLLQRDLWRYLLSEDASRRPGRD